ncbi:MAG: Lrp/AsnC ligand binding domain-containing protein [Candidatus Bathyarchaeota archaeon]|jgi:DNA-binding Lrp family transcriptional regulator|nr:Lrp/AsnC ligand binding domain-containing protein [Candidatus Bathyarchaeota archaeon]
MPVVYILINAELGMEEDLLQELRKMENIKEAYLAYGVYDVIVKAEAENMENLKELVAFKIRRMKEVKNTLTMTVAEGV